MAAGPRPEARRGANVEERGVAGPPRREALQDFGRAVAVAEVAHVDERAVVGLERVARVELGYAVGADHLPVGAAGQHASGELLAAEAAAGDGNDAPPAERRVAQLLRWRERDLSPKEELKRQSKRFTRQAISAA